MSNVRCLELVCLETVKFESTGQKYTYLFSPPPCGLLSHLKACRHRCLAPLPTWLGCPWGPVAMLTNNTQNQGKDRQNVVPS